MIGRRTRTFLTLAAWAYIVLGVARGLNALISVFILSPDAPRHMELVPAWERAAWSIGETVMTGGILLILLSIDARLEARQ